MDKKTKRNLSKGTVISADLKGHSITTTLSACGKSGTEVSEQDMSGMFYDSQAKTVYARTQADADKFNSSVNKPNGLQVIVKQ